MILRLAILAVLLAFPADAQTPAPAPLPGLQQARNMLDRMVRVVGRQTPGLPGETGFGLITGEQPGPQGTTLLVIVVPDHLVRDPARADGRFLPPGVLFPAEPARGVSAQLLEQRLTPAEGDLAVILVTKPTSLRYRALTAANTTLLIAGTPAWQSGRANELTTNPVPGRMALRDRVDFLDFAGFDNRPASAGAAVVGDRGLIGLVTGPNQTDRLLTRVLPVEMISARMRAWGLPWDIAVPDGVAPPASTGSLSAMTGSGAAPTGLAASTVPTAPSAISAPASGPAAPAGAFQLAPLSIVMLLPAEAAARTSWTPPDAKASPWADTPVRVFSSPRRDAPQIATLPPGRTLPADLLSRGGYDIVGKYDGGAWFLLGTGGEPIGYAAGGDIVEIWPMQQTSGLAGGKVIREWNAAPGQLGVLRDVGTAFELETAVTCKAEQCDSIIIYTPVPPNAGSIVPAFQVLPLSGSWKRNDVMAVRMAVPRRVVETAGTKLYACVGREGDCDQQTLLPPPER